MKIIFQISLNPTSEAAAIIDSMWFDISLQTPQQIEDYEKIARNLVRFIQSMSNFVYPPVDPKYVESLEAALGKDVGSEFAYLYGVISKEQCNSFGLYTYCYEGPRHDRQSYATALFPFAIFFNHSCSPNVGRMYNHQGNMEFFALRDIPKGQEATITYLSLDLSRRERQELLKSVFFFTCDCARCEAESAGFYLFDSSLTICGKDSCRAPLAPIHKAWVCLGCQSSVTSLIASGSE
jgi:hypothetical protein